MINTDNRVSRKVFFSEDNLFVLLNVAHDTISDPQAFNKITSPDRQLLFAEMSTTFTNNEGRTLTDMNKLVLRNVYSRVIQKKKDTRNEISNSELHLPIRDADLNQRPVPSHFQERPQLTSMSTIDDSAADTHKKNRVDVAMQLFEEKRVSDITSKPKAIQFEDDTIVDNTDVNLRMDDIIKQREENVDTDLHIPQNNKSVLSNALFDFATQSQKIDLTVDNATADREKSNQSQETHFQENTRFNPSVDGETITGQSIQDNRFQPVVDSELEQQLSQSQNILHNEPLSTRLDADITVKTETDKMKMDEREFQKKLHMGEEEDALVDYMETTGTCIQEEFIIPARAKYTNTVHYLEVSSSDRSRNIHSNETPNSFTVYFNSNRPDVVNYAIYDEHYLEEPEEYYTTRDGCEVFLDTINVRKCRGLRGLPLAFGNYPQIDNTQHITYETVQLNNVVAGPNVDTVFSNVVALKTNHVQVYFPYDKAPVHPYILLQIEQFSNVYQSSNQSIRKSFCKLFYDRSSAPTTGNALYHTFVPMNNEKKIFKSPLSNIDRLHFSLYNSCGQRLDTIKDTHHVHKVAFDLTVDNEKICIVLKEYVHQKHFTENNNICFDKCMEWYNKEWFEKWHDEVGSRLLQQQTDLQEQIGEKLSNCTGLSVEEIQCIKDEFALSQVKFAFPTLGYPTGDAINDILIKDLATLVEHLTRPMGHRLIGVGSYNNDIFTTVSAEQGINCICIDMKKEFDKLTGIYSLFTYELGLPSLNKQLQNNVDYPLIVATLYNQSVHTNISMSVITREDENVILNKNI